MKADYSNWCYIVAIDRLGVKYRVAKLSYREDKLNNTYSYVFEPNYPIIDLLDDSDFFGIPGIDLEKRKPQYVRENRVPSFVINRVPMENRVDYRELLEEAGLQCMEPIEYMVRSGKHASNDRLDVCGKDSPTSFVYEDYCTQGHSKEDCARFLLTSLASGGTVRMNGKDARIPEDINLFLYARSELEELVAERREKHAAVGRKRLEIEKDFLVAVMKEYESKKLKDTEAAANLNVSIATFYRLLKEIRREEKEKSLG